MPAPGSVLPESRLLLLCLLNDPQSRRDREVAELCGAAHEVAQSLTARPVDMVQVGDPAVLEPGATTLLLQAAVERLSGQSLLLLSARSRQIGGPPGELFGPAPRAIPLGPDLASAATPVLRDLFRPLLGHAASAQPNTLNLTGD